MEEGSVTLEDNIEYLLKDPLDWRTPYRALVMKEDLQTINRILPSFNERARLVIKLSFGLDGYACIPVCEIARILGRKPEDIRRTRNRALKHMYRILMNHLLPDRSLEKVNRI